MELALECAGVTFLFPIIFEEDLRLFVSQCIPGLRR